MANSQETAFRKKSVSYYLVFRFPFISATPKPKHPMAFANRLVARAIR